MQLHESLLNNPLIKKARVWLKSAIKSTLETTNISQPDNAHFETIHATELVDESKKVADFLSNALKGLIQYDGPFEVKPSLLRSNCEQEDQTIYVKDGGYDSTTPIAIIRKNSPLSDLDELIKFLSGNDLQIIFSRIYNDKTMQSRVSQSHYYKAGLADQKGNVLLFAQNALNKINERKDQKTQNMLAVLQFLEKTVLLQEVQAGNLTDNKLIPNEGFEKVRPIIAGAEDQPEKLKNKIDDFIREVRSTISERLGEAEPATK